MADTIHLEIVTPNALFFEGEVEMAVIPGSEGEFGVLPQHAPLISQLRPGIITLTEAGKEQKIFVSGGYADVTPQRCAVLAQEALPLAEITPELVEARSTAAQKALRKAESEIVRKKAEADLEVAKAMEVLITGKAA